MWCLFWCLFFRMCLPLKNLAFEQRQVPCSLEHVPLESTGCLSFWGFGTRCLVVLKNTTKREAEAIVGLLQTTNMYPSQQECPYPHGYCPPPEKKKEKRTENREYIHPTTQRPSLAWPLEVGAPKRRSEADDGKWSRH